MAFFNANIQPTSDNFLLISYHGVDRFQIFEIRNYFDVQNWVYEFLRT